MGIASQCKSVWTNSQAREFRDVHVTCPREVTSDFHSAFAICNLGGKGNLTLLLPYSQWIVLVHGKNEILYFCFVNAEFYRVVWTINALLIIRSEMIPFSENNQNTKMFGVPPNTLPLVMYIMIICHWAILHYNMSFKTIAGRSDGVFWWFPALSEDQEEKKPKLYCGFNCIF